MILTRRSAILSLLATTLTMPLASARRGPRTLAAPGGAGDSARARFLRAVEEGDLESVRYLLAAEPGLASARDDTGRSAFVLACLARHREVGGALLDTGLELDVVEAVLAEDWERFGALVEADPGLCNALHPIGGTPLHAAALAGQIQMWRLRSAGCLPDARPAGGSGFTPARAAVDCAWISGARIAATDLLSNGGDPNAAQARGDSVLHGAVRRKSELLVRLAVRKGADVLRRDAEGRTARELASALGWEEGARLLAGHAELPRDHRASRFAFDANLEPIERPDLSDVPQARQSEVTSNSHGDLARVRELVGPDPRLVFSISTDDELAIEACAHIGNRDIIRYHLDHGAPLSLPTAVALGDLERADALLRRDPLLVHERGAHDFPVLWYVVLGRAGTDMLDLLLSRGASPDQESHGNTALHWCVMRGDPDLARALIERGADLDAVGYKWSEHGQTPLQLARAEGRDTTANLLLQAGARDLPPADGAPTMR